MSIVDIQEEDSPVAKTEQRFRGIISNIAYDRHDGCWTLFLGRDDTRFYLQVKCSASADGPWSGRKWALSPHMVTSEVVRTAYFAIMQAEHHEIDEKFTYKGAAVYNPHMDLDALADEIHASKIPDEVRANGMTGV